MQQGNFIDVFLARHVSGTCRAKNTSIKLPCCIKLAFQIVAWGRCTVTTLKRQTVSINKESREQLIKHIE